MVVEDDRMLPVDRLWSIDEVSYFLGVPVATLYYWRCRGEARRRPYSAGTCGPGGGRTGLGRGAVELQQDVRT